LFCLNAQTVFTHVRNVAVYEFLDEMANEKLIEINSAVKPYSRSFIAGKLNELSLKVDSMNDRQVGELNFFKKEYVKELNFSSQNLKNGFPNSRDSIKRIDAFFYQDSILTLTVNPIVGVSYIANQDHVVKHIYSGGEIFGKVGKNLGFYASLRDNQESTMLSSPMYLNQNVGAEYKKDGKGGGDYSEMRGGVTYTNKWASIGLIKDHFVWGNNYNGSNIFSGRTPSFAQVLIKLHPTDWLDFNYVHGYLVSGFVDSVNSYQVNGVTRAVYHEKFLSANFFTLKPVKYLNVSFGNSVVYSDVGKNPVYLIPIFFYKSLDHTYSPQSNNGGQNAQMFFDVSSRNLKHFHFYSSVYIDEISISRMWIKAKQSNFISSKIGFRANNLGLKNLFFTLEFTRTNPIVYKHYIATTSFSSNNYNLGHYLKDNSSEYFMSLAYKPIARLSIKYAFTSSKVGNNYPDIRKPNLVWGLPFQSDIKWESRSHDFSISYQVKNDFFINTGFVNSNIQGSEASFYTPSFLLGKKNTFTTGINFGF
jgi:hypothetical protein